MHTHTHYHACKHTPTAHMHTGILTSVHRCTYTHVASASACPRACARPRAARVQCVNSAFARTQMWETLLNVLLEPMLDQDPYHASVTDPRLVHTPIPQVQEGSCRSYHLVSFRLLRRKSYAPCGACAATLPSCDRGPQPLHARRGPLQVRQGCDGAAPAAAAAAAAFPPCLVRLRVQGPYVGHIKGNKHQQPCSVSPLGYCP